MTDEEKLVSSELYTTEAESLKNKVAEELKIPDPEDDGASFAEKLAEATTLNKEKKDGSNS